MCKVLVILKMIVSLTSLSAAWPRRSATPLFPRELCKIIDPVKIFDASCALIAAGNRRMVALVLSRLKESRYKKRRKTKAGSKSNLLAVLYP